MFWPTKKLGEVVDFLDNLRKPVTASDRVPGPYPYYGANGQQDSVNDYIFDEDLVLLAEDGGYFGSKDRPIAYRISGKTWVNNHAHVLRAKKGIAETGFIHYRLMFYDIKPYITGSTRTKLNKSAAEKIKIPLPPLEIQKQIVGRLDKITEAQKLNDGLIQKSDELFQSLLHKELNPAGKNWEIKKIKDIAIVGNGGTPSTKNQKYWNGKILWLTPKELSGFEDMEIFNTERKISDQGLNHSSAAIFPTGTVLFTSRAPIGYIAIAGVPMATNQGFKNFVCDSKQLNNKFLYFFLRLKKKYLQSLGRGATFTEISKTIVEKVEIPLPPLEIQKQIVAKLSAVQDYKKQLLEQKSKLKELFDSSLAKAFNREL